MMLWRANRLRGTASGCFPLAVFVIALCLADARVVVAATGEDPDWPCVQRKVAEISAGQVWNGPPLDTSNAWRDDNAAADLARNLASRRTELDAAKALIADFATTAGPDKNRRLTLVFSGVLEVINQDRGSILNGIGRYARRQKSLADKIETQSAELDTLPVNGTAEQKARRDELDEMQTWDTRIFQERERSLRYVCELPVLLEQRAYAIGKEIAGHLDK